MALSPLLAASLISNAGDVKSMPAVVSAHNAALPLHKQIVQGVKKHVESLARQTVGKVSLISELEIKVQSIDQRLQLKPCSQALTFESNEAQRLPGRALVKASCQGAAPWSLYVPANVSWVQPIVFSAHSLQRGQNIDASDVYIDKVRITRAGVQYLHSIDQVLGKMTARRLAADKPIDWRFLQQADLVRKGETVQLIAKNGSIAIRIDGEALGNGSKGEQIRVRNTLSNRVVDAMVIARGKAEIRL